MYSGSVSSLLLLAAARCAGNSSLKAQGKVPVPAHQLFRSRRAPANHDACSTGYLVHDDTIKNRSCSASSLCFSASAHAGAAHYKFVPQESFIVHDHGREASRTTTATTRKALYASSSSSSSAASAASASSSSTSPPNRHVRRRKKGLFIVRALGQKSACSQSGTATISISIAVDSRIGGAQSFGSRRRALRTNASRLLPVARLTHHGWRWLLLFRPGIRVGPGQVRFCFWDALNSAPNGFKWVLSDAGHAQGTACSAESRHSVSSLHQRLRSVQSATTTPAFYFWRPMLLQLEHGSPPEAMPVPIQIVDSTQQCLPCFMSPC
ncbi:hypothetical protein GGI43DRAFT_301337 [Trichoderma evansii]